jgi:transcriptional regulator with XRE-family HTH domain
MNRLRETRQEKKLTLKEVSDKLKARGVKVLPDSLAKYERGDREPKLETWQKLAAFFKVSVPYLQGLTFSKKEIAQMVIPLIHKAYFDDYKFTHSKVHIGVRYLWLSSSFSPNIDTYISVTTEEPTPYKLYKQDEQDFALTNKVKNYWQTCLAPLFEIMESKDLLKEQYGNQKDTSYFLLREFEDALDDQVEELSKGNGSVTALGYMFSADFDDNGQSEKILHQKMRALLLHGSEKAAKKALNEYIDLMLRLRDAVNSFNEHDFLLDRYKNYAANVQNPFGADLVINELSKEIEGGNNDLLSYVMHRGEDASLAKSYYQYKKERGESTKQLDELIKKNKQIKPFFKDQGFIKYFLSHSDSGKTKTYSEVLRLHEKYMEQKKNS